MKDITYEDIAELHNHAAYAHMVAACAHGNGDHATAFELSRSAEHHSQDALDMAQDEEPEQESSMNLGL